MSGEVAHGVGRRVHILVDPGRRDPVNRQTLRYEPMVAPLIMGALSILTVQMTVDLDGQSGGGAEEVEDVDAYWMLTPKAGRTWRTSSKARPEHDLRLGHDSPQKLGSLERQN